MNVTPSGPPSLIPASDCKLRIEFLSKTHWPDHLPAIALNQVIIAGSKGKWVFNHQIESQSGCELAETFKNFHPHLSYLELLQIVPQWKAAFNVSVTAFLKAYQLDWSDTDSELEKFFRTFPASTQLWLVEKSLSKSELSQIKDLASRAQTITSFCVQQKVSKSELTQVLDLCSSINSDQALPQPGDNFRSWSEKLFSLKYPITQSMDKYFQAKIKTLPWSKNSSAQWLRRGDKSGIEVRFFVTQTNELKNQIHALMKVSELLQEDQEWNIEKH
jgi:hypothetical protein